MSFDEQPKTERLKKFEPKPVSLERFKFKVATLPPEAFSYQHYVAQGFSKAKAKHVVAAQKLTTVFLSDTYQVNVKRVEIAPNHWMIWLSIKRVDKDVIHDWRELQRIKNVILGKEIEAVELYPAESRLVDSANQYHLWAIPKGNVFPFGYPKRDVGGVPEAAAIGAVQRPFENEALDTHAQPVGLLDADYELEENGVWLGIDNIAVRVVRTDEGVVVDLYPNGREDSEPLASTYAHFDEARDELESTSSNE